MTAASLRPSLRARAQGFPKDGTEANLFLLSSSSCLPGNTPHLQGTANRRQAKQPRGKRASPPPIRLTAGLLGEQQETTDRTEAEAPALHRLLGERR